MSGAQNNTAEAMPDMLRKLLLRELSQAGFPGATYLPETGQINIPLDGQENQPLITAKGNLLYHMEHCGIANETLLPITARVRGIAAWEQSREMPVPDLPEFRMLAEYNGVVLAARDDTESGYGLHFVIWEYSHDRTGMREGHYTEDYSHAKEDFAVRSGLISKDRLFTPEQVAEIKTSVEYRTENDWRVTYAQQDILDAVTAKLNGEHPASGSAERDSPAKKPSIGEKLREGKEKADAKRARNPAPPSAKRDKEVD